MVDRKDWQAIGETRLRPGVRRQATRDAAFGPTLVFQAPIDDSARVLEKSGVTATALQDASAFRKGKCDASGSFHVATGKSK
jgi:hypothetical protein